MRRTLTAAVAALMIAGSLGAGDGSQETFGDGLTLATPVAIQTLLATPDDYLGKKVRVDGVVSAVCQHRGCWMQVTDPATDSGIRIKVEDGVIVFPPSAVGRKASAEGVFEAIPVAPATQSVPSHQHGEDEAHQATCAGEPVGERIFVIRGTGAVVYEATS